MTGFAVRCLTLQKMLHYGQCSIFYLSYISMYFYQRHKEHIFQSWFIGIHLSDQYDLRCLRIFPRMDPPIHSYSCWVVAPPSLSLAPPSFPLAHDVWRLLQAYRPPDDNFQWYIHAALTDAPPCPNGLQFWAQWKDDELPRFPTSILPFSALTTDYCGILLH